MGADEGWGQQGSCEGEGNVREGSRQEMRVQGYGSQRGEGVGEGQGAQRGMG